jgi:hypothetical protein
MVWYGIGVSLSVSSVAAWLGERATDAMLRISGREAEGLGDPIATTMPLGAQSP